MNVITNIGNRSNFGDLYIGDGFIYNEDLCLKCSPTTAFNFAKNYLDNFCDGDTVYFLKKANCNKCKNYMSYLCRNCIHRTSVADYYQEVAYTTIATKVNKGDKEDDTSLLEKCGFEL